MALHSNAEPKRPLYTISCNYPNLYRDFRLLAVMDLVAHVRDANHAISYSTESIRFGGSLMRAYVIADAGLRLQLREKIEVS